MRPRTTRQRSTGTGRPATAGWTSSCATSSAGASFYTDHRRRSPSKVHSPDHAVTVHRDRRARRTGDTTGALVLVVDPVDSLRDPLDDGWAASPIDRMEELLRAGGVPIGVVTDGRWWAIVSARQETMVASGIVDAQTWIEEPADPQRVRRTAQRRRLIGGKPEDRLTELFGESVAAAEEITEALGTQVRRAVELLVQAFSEAALDAAAAASPTRCPPTARRHLRGRGHGDDAGGVPAVRRGTRPAAAEPAVRHGLRHQRRARRPRPARPRRRRRSPRRHAPDLAPAARHLARRSTAARRSRTCGCPPTAARCSTRPASRSSPPATRTAPWPSRSATGSCCDVLRAVQIAQLRGRARAADLVPRHRRRADRLHLRRPARLLLRQRRRGHRRPDRQRPAQEPEIPLAALEELAAANRTPRPKLADAILAWAKNDQPAAKPPTKAALAKAIRDSADVEDADRALRAVTPTDADLRERLRPFIGIIRRDLRDRPDGRPRPAACWSWRNAVPRDRRRPLHAQVPRRGSRPARARTAVLRPGSAPDRRRDSWQLGRLRRDPRPQGRRHRLRLRRVPRRRRPLPRRPARRSVDREDAATPHAHDDLRPTRSARSSPAASTARTSTPWPSRCASCRSGSSRSTRSCRSPSSTTRSCTATRCSASPISEQLEVPAHRPCVRRQPVRLFGARRRRHHPQAVELRRNLATEVNDDDPQRPRQRSAASGTDYQELTADSPRSPTASSPPGLQLGGKPGRALDEAYENLRIAVARRIPTAGHEPDRDCSTHPRRRSHPDCADRLRALEAAALGPRSAGRHGTRRLRRHHRQPAVPRRQEAHRRDGHERPRLARQRSRERQEGQRRPGRLLLPAGACRC